jgi:hypothetical protein
MKMTDPICSRRCTHIWMGKAEGNPTVKKLIMASVFAAVLAASVGGSPAMAACNKHCWKECTYEAGGRCYVWANKCEAVCTLPAWKYDKNLPKSSGGKWVPNSPSKGISGTPANNTWTPNSGPTLRSSGGRR